MLIKLDESAVKKWEKITEEEIRCIENIALGVSEGNHLLIVDFTVLEKLKKIKEISTRAKKVFIRLEGKIFLIGGILKKVTRYVLICKTNEIFIEEKNEKKIYKVPLEYFSKLSRVQPSNLLCEDLSDGILYKRMTQLYIKNKRLGIDIKEKLLNGGGLNSWKIYKEAIENDETVLAIMDSDKEHQTAQIGKTARKVTEVFNSVKNTGITDIYVLKSREKENIFPPHIYELCSKAKGEYKEAIEALKFIVETNKEMYLYLDIKDGKYSKEVLDLLKNKDREEIACATEDNQSVKKMGVGSLLDLIRSEIMEEKIEAIIEEKMEIYNKTNREEILKEIMKLKENKDNSKNIFEICKNVGIYEDIFEITQKIIDFGCCLQEFVV